RLETGAAGGVRTGDGQANRGCERLSRHVEHSLGSAPKYCLGARLSSRGKGVVGCGTERGRRLPRTSQTRDGAPMRRAVRMLRRRIPASTTCGLTAVAAAETEGGSAALVGADQAVHAEHLGLDPGEQLPHGEAGLELRIVAQREDPEVVVVRAVPLRRHRAAVAGLAVIVLSGGVELRS